MRRTRRAWVVLWLLFFSPAITALAAEEPEALGHGPTLASAEATYYGFVGLANPSAGSFEEDLEASMRVVSAKAGFPLTFRDNNIVMFNSLFFDQTHFEYRNWDFSVTPRNQQPRDFYAVGWEYALINRVAEKAWLITRLSWGLYSDLKEVDGNDDRLQGAALVNFAVTDTIGLGGGISYNSDFGFPAPVPFVHFGYYGRFFRADVTVPSQAEIFAIVHERVELGIKGRLSGNEYRMTYVDDAVLDNLKVQVSTIDTGLAVNARLFAGLWLNLFGGGTLNNRYKAVLTTGDELRDISLTNTWFFSAGLAYNL